MLLDQLQNPTNVLLLGVLAYLLYPILTASNKLPDNWSKVPRSHLESYSWMPEKLPGAVVWRSYTPRQLRAFDGTANPTAPILFAIQGKIYDVTAGRGFYGPGGPYGNFAGRDASRGLAKQSFEMDMLTPLDAPIDDLSDLTESERANLREWELHFQNKYFQCGDFVEEP